jgi:hypothetical protein
MPSTTKLSDTIAWAQAFVNYAQLAIGVDNEPSITNANTIMQTIVGPPFAWPWNRSKQSFVVDAGIQDYLVAISNFGYLEKAAVQPAAHVTATSLTSNVATYTAINSFKAGDLVTVTGSTNGAAFNVTNAVIASATATQFTVAIVSVNIASAPESSCLAVSGQAFPLEIKNEPMTEGVEQSRPSFISTQIDDNSGKYTFRVLPIPNKTYQITLTFQNSATLFLPSSLSAPWGIPDKYAYIFNYGFLFLTLDYWDDPRAARYRQLFIATLLGAAEGLTEQEKNLFLGNWLITTSQAQASGMKTQQGISGRGV